MSSSITCFALHSVRLGVTYFGHVLIGIEYKCQMVSIIIWWLDVKCNMWSSMIWKETLNNGAIGIAFMGLSLGSSDVRL